MEYTHLRVGQRVRFKTLHGDKTGEIIRLPESNKVCYSAYILDDTNEYRMVSLPNITEVIAQPADNS